MVWRRGAGRGRGREYKLNYGFIIYTSSQREYTTSRTNGS